MDFVLYLCYICVGMERFFVRLVSFSSDSHSSEAEALFVEAIDHLGLVIGRDESTKQGTKKTAVQNVSYAANHVFLNVVSPDSVVPLSLYLNELQRICSKYWFKMVRLGISTVEFKLGCNLTPESEPTFVRLVASNPTGNPHQLAHSNPNLHQLTHSNPSPHQLTHSNHNNNSNNNNVRVIFGRFCIEN